MSQIRQSKSSHLTNPGPTFPLQAKLNLPDPKNKNLLSIKGKFSRKRSMSASLEPQRSNVGVIHKSCRMMPQTRARQPTASSLEKHESPPRNGNDEGKTRNLAEAVPFTIISMSDGHRPTMLGLDISVQLTCLVVELPGSQGKNGQCQSCPT